MKTTVQLETKDVRAMIARFFEIPQDNVIQNRYSFSVAGMSAEEIEKKLGGEGEKQLG